MGRAREGHVIERFEVDVLAPCVHKMVSLLAASFRKIIRATKGIWMYSFALTENSARLYSLHPSEGWLSAEVDQQLIDAIDFTKEANRYVALLLDEVHIKEDLVYDKHSGSLIGFANMGDINNHLINFERSLTDEPGELSIASSVLVIMVRGLLSKLNFPYAQFAVAT